MSGVDFKDSQGRRWRLELCTGSLDRLLGPSIGTLAEQISDHVGAECTVLRCESSDAIEVRFRIGDTHHAMRIDYEVLVSDGGMAALDEIRDHILSERGAS